MTLNEKFLFLSNSPAFSILQLLKTLPTSRVFRRFSTIFLQKIFYFLYKIYFFLTQPLLATCHLDLCSGFFFTTLILVVILTLITLSILSLQKIIRKVYNFLFNGVLFFHIFVYKRKQNKMRLGAYCPSFFRLILFFFPFIYVSLFLFYLPH